MTRKQALPNIPNFGEARDGSGLRWEYYQIFDTQHVCHGMYCVRKANTELSFYFETSDDAALFLIALARAR